MALQIPCCQRFSAGSRVAGSSFELWLETQRFVFFVCFATLIFEFILGGWCFAMSKRYLHSFGNDDRIQHFSRRNFPCCSHTKHSMNVSNNDNRLSTIKTLAKGHGKWKRNKGGTSPFSQVSPKGLLGGGVLFFFATLRASRDENTACPQGPDSSRGDEGSLLEVSCLTESSGSPPHLVCRFII